VILLDEVEAWFLVMVDGDPESAVLVAAAAGSPRRGRSHARSPGG
jgi:hypothetical protein